jgi:hypothetical protein
VGAFTHNLEQMAMSPGSDRGLIAIAASISRVADLIEQLITLVAAEAAASAATKSVARDRRP